MNSQARTSSGSREAKIGIGAPTIFLGKADGHGISPLERAYSTRDTKGRGQNHEKSLKDFLGR
jgi:hypothetical protein